MGPTCLQRADRWEPVSILVAALSDSKLAALTAAKVPDRRGRFAALACSDEAVEPEALQGDRSYDSSLF